MNGVRLEAERLGTEFLGGGALDPTIRETSDGGTPITVAEPDNPHALVFCRMGAHLG
jgi:ATP-binding protein involved in chromosome partitioning